MAPCALGQGCVPICTRVIPGGHAPCLEHTPPEVDQQQDLLFEPGLGVITWPQKQAGCWGMHDSVLVGTLAVDPAGCIRIYKDSSGRLHDVLVTVILRGYGTPPFD